MTSKIISNTQNSVAGSLSRLARLWEWNPSIPSGVRPSPQRREEKP